MELISHLKLYEYVLALSSSSGAQRFSTFVLTSTHLWDAILLRATRRLLIVVGAWGEHIRFLYCCIIWVRWIILNANLNWFCTSVYLLHLLFVTGTLSVVYPLYNPWELSALCRARSSENIPWPAWVCQDSRFRKCGVHVHPQRRSALSSLPEGSASVHATKGQEGKRKT